MTFVSEIEESVPIFYHEAKLQLKSPMELSSRNKMLLRDSACENVSLPRDSFYFLNSSTHYALYHDLFDQNAMHVPNSFKLHFALQESNKVHTNYNVHIEEK